MAWAQENGLSTAARLAAAEPAGQLRFYARLVLDTGEVFGAVPPSSALQRIDRNNYDINIDADGTMTAFRIFTDRLAYTNLAIRAADKQEIMGEMERKAHTLDN